MRSSCRTPILAFVLFSAAQTLAEEKAGYVHHPAPKDPVFLDSRFYESLRKVMPAPPASGSSEQKADEAEVLRIQKARTAADCDRAKSEVFVGLQSFFGPPAGPLDEAQVRKLAPFFEQIRNDADYFIQKLKKEYPRQRPFVYIAGVEPCVPKEVTQSYPSGHGILSRLYALILSDLYPALTEPLGKRAKQLGDDRVLVGVHHPSDIAVGGILAERIYTEMKKSKKFQTELKKIREN